MGAPTLGTTPSGPHLLRLPPLLFSPLPAAPPASPNSTPPPSTPTLPPLCSVRVPWRACSLVLCTEMEEMDVMEELAEWVGSAPEMEEEGECEEDDPPRVPRRRGFVGDAGRDRG